MSPSAPDVEKYELLNVFELTSARKRIRVVMRVRIMLYLSS